MDSYHLRCTYERMLLCGKSFNQSIKTNIINDIYLLSIKNGFPNLEFSETIGRKCSIRG